MDRKQLKNESIYSVFIRNHSESGDIIGLINDLKRIKDMGFTIIWILPHYEVADTPYSVINYEKINKDYGTVKDFKELVSKCHILGLKLIIDIVFNHTSKLSNLVTEHPEWYIQDDNGKMMSKVSGWDEVFDLDFNNTKLREYLINNLNFWAKMGVDGFRCDMASIIPLDFWTEARENLNKNFSNLIWIGVDVEKTFITFIRRKGHVCLSDSELYRVFDILYDYDVQYSLEGYIKREISFDDFVKERQTQEQIYPADYLKLRYLENHDSPQRAASLIESDFHLKNWKAFSMFEKGIPLIYAGEEYKIKKKPSLYHHDPIDWENGDRSYAKIIRKMLNIEHFHIVLDGVYYINNLTEDCIHLRYQINGETLHGIFNFGDKNSSIKLKEFKGHHFNLLSGNDFLIDDSPLVLDKAPYIFKTVP